MLQYFENILLQDEVSIIGCGSAGVAKMAATLDFTQD